MTNNWSVAIFPLSSVLSFDMYIDFVMTKYILIVHVFMCVKLNSLFDSDMMVYYVTQVLNQGINIKTMCPFYILKYRNTTLHLVYVYLCMWAKI